MGYNVPLPEGTSGWYLPSSGQLCDYISNLSGYSLKKDATSTTNMIGRSSVAVSPALPVALALNDKLKILDDANYTAFPKALGDAKIYTSSTEVSDEYNFIFYFNSPITPAPLS